jgi:hypothetical protein
MCLFRLVVIVKVHGSKTRKRQGETQGSTEISAFMSFTLYFFPLFGSPSVFAKHKVRTLSFDNFINNFNMFP